VTPVEELVTVTVVGDVVVVESDVLEVVVDGIVP
jgi:hypothetical protein